MNSLISNSYSSPNAHTICLNKFIWISISNLIAIILSFSLLLPWAKIRMYNYIVSCTKINIHGDLDKIVDEANSVKSAFGEEFAESQDIEVSI